MPGPLPDPEKRPSARRALKAAETRAQGTPPSRPGPPDHLRDAGRALWRQIQDDLDDSLELDAREEAILERACRMADLADGLAADLRERGRWIEGSTGRQRLNPAVTELRQAENAVASLLSKVQLGTPRPRTGHLSGRERNKLRDVIAGRA
jgi:P27 family predicted phage terminase small subunit